MNKKKVLLSIITINLIFYIFHVAGTSSIIQTPSKMDQSAASSTSLGPTTSPGKSAGASDNIFNFGEARVQEYLSSLSEESRGPTLPADDELEFSPMLLQLPCHEVLPELKLPGSGPVTRSRKRKLEPSGGSNNSSSSASSISSPTTSHKHRRRHKRTKRQRTIVVE